MHAYDFFTCGISYFHVELLETQYDTSCPCSLVATARKWNSHFIFTNSNHSLRITNKKDYAAEENCSAKNAKEAYIIEENNEVYIYICLIRIQNLSSSQIDIFQNNSFFLVLLYKKRIFINKLVSLIWCCSFVFHQFCLILTRAIRYRSSLTRISFAHAHSHTFKSRVHRARIIAFSGGPTSEVLRTT